jgi:peptidyl-prolyl cis-trans isomerase B (cyclophilin B)
MKFAAFFTVLTFGSVAFYSTACASARAEAPRVDPPTAEDAAAVKGQPLQAVIETTRGVIRLELFTDEAPLTVANFKNLADAGFYDGVTFHRVVPDFMIQGGDPDATGTGGPGYRFDDEESALQLPHDSPGILSMANAGPDTNGSQFFITHVPTPHLNGKHAVFGRVVQGQDVVNAIRAGDVMRSVIVVEASEADGSA